MSDVTGSTFVPSQSSDTSPAIGQLAAALAAAQGKITGAVKDSVNPAFAKGTSPGSKYADLAACWDACRGPLSENGLAVIQTTRESADGVLVLTTLAHKSGEWIRGALRMTPTKADPQGIGSCLTYARRYALAAIVGLAQIDDDANAASNQKGTSVAAAVLETAGWTAAQSKQANAYVVRLEKCFADDLGEINELGVKELWNEIRSNQEMATAVWAQLKKFQKDFIKASCKEVA